MPIERLKSRQPFDGKLLRSGKRGCGDLELGITVCKQFEPLSRERLGRAQGCGEPLKLPKSLGGKLLGVS